MKDRGTETPRSHHDHHDIHETSFGGESEIDPLLPDTPGENQESGDFLKEVWPNANLSKLHYDQD